MYGSKDKMGTCPQIKKRNFLPVLFFCFFALKLFSQEDERTDFRTVYLEIGGNGGVYSVNYENRLKGFSRSRLNWRLGFTVWPDPETFRPIAAIPAGINWLYGTGKHRFEAGTGQLLVLDYLRGNGATLIASFRAGYRFEPPAKRYYLSAAYTPFYYYLREADYQHWWGFAFGLYLKKKE